METVLSNRNNVVAKVTKENHLVIDVDMNVQGTPSSTGKTMCLATTGGFSKLIDAHGNQIMFSLNVNQK